MIALKRRSSYTPRSDVPPALSAALSPRQCQIAIRVADGLCDKEIAAELQIAPVSIRTYVRRIAKKLDLDPARNARIQITRTVVLAFADMEDAA